MAPSRLLVFCLLTLGGCVDDPGAGPVAWEGPTAKSFRSGVCYDAEVISAADYDGDMTTWFGINASGDMVGNFCADASEPCGDYDAPVWGALRDAARGELTWFEPPDGYNVVQTAGIGDGGEVVGTAVAGNGSGGVAGAAAFRLEDGVATVFDDPLDDGYYAATDINARGSVVGYSRRYAGAYSGRVGWILRADGTHEEIVVPGAARTFPFGIDNRGDVVGYYLDGTYGYYGAFRLPARGAIEILTPPEVFFEDFTEVYAHGISNDGTIVGWYMDWVNMERGAFVWPRGGERTPVSVLDYSDAVFHDINEAGAIVGTAEGNTDGLLLSPADCE